jgi:hypothetical protein
MKVAGLLTLTLVLLLRVDALQAQDDRGPPERLRVPRGDAAISFVTQPVLGDPSAPPSYCTAHCPAGYIAVGGGFTGFGIHGGGGADTCGRYSIADSSSPNGRKEGWNVVGTDAIRGSACHAICLNHQHPLASRIVNRPWSSGVRDGDTGVMCRSSCNDGAGDDYSVVGGEWSCRVPTPSFSRIDKKLKAGWEAYCAEGGFMSCSSRCLPKSEQAKIVIVDEAESSSDGGGNCYAQCPIGYTPIAGITSTRVSHSFIYDHRAIGGFAGWFMYPARKCGAVCLKLD